MENKSIAQLITLKVICCGVVLFFLLGGLSLLVGISTENIVLAGLGVLILLWAVYKLAASILDKTRHNS